MRDIPKIKCSHCGKENLVDAKNCEECGLPLDGSGKSGNPNRWFIILLIALLLIGAIGAYFGFRNTPDPDKVEIKAKSSDPTMGTVIGGGNYAKDTIITLMPQAADGYIFVAWDDGDTTNPREVKTVETKEYVAIFKTVESTRDDLESGISNSNEKSDEQDNSLTSLTCQQKFDELCGRFDLRMKDELTYENALVLITGDYEVLDEILRMLDNNPGLTADSRNQYIDRFQTHADTAIRKINDAVFSTSLEPSQREELYSKYIPQKRIIEQMRNSL